MVTILTPLSLPTDIQQQTIYTVVSKPVRRLELIWGRMIGYMALVTVLVARLRRDQPALPVADRRRHDRRRPTAAAAEGREGEPAWRTPSCCWSRPTSSARGCRPGCRSRARCRSSTRGARRTRWGSTSARTQSMQEPRSHIEGATPSAAIWSFGRVPDPFTPPGRQPRILDRRIPVERFPPPEYDRVGPRPVYQLDGADRRRPAGQAAAQRAGGRGPASSTRRSPAIRQELDRVRAEYDGLKKRQSDELEAQATEAEAGGRKPTRPTTLREAGRPAPLAADHRRDDLQRLPDHQGEDRRAGLRRDRGDQPPHRQPSSRATSSRSRSTTPTRCTLPPSILAGSDGALQIEIRCLSPTQYLGMAESDLYPAAAVGELRRQLHEGALRRLAPGDGPDRHRRLRRHVPELAGGPLDDDRLLRRRAARLRLPGRLHRARPSWAAARSSR